MIPEQHTPRNSIEIAGLEIQHLGEKDVIQNIFAALHSREGGWIVTANADIARQCHQHPDLQRMIADADLIVADGMPLIWASRILRQPLPGRVCGSNLVWSIAERAAQERFSLFLLGGGQPETASNAASILRERYPGLNIVGTHYPPFGFESSSDEMARLRAALDAAAPDVVYVALGFPKAERLIHHLRSEYPKTWWIGVGISLSFIAGEVARAPGWMQGIGLEWLHRLLQEPGRLAKRYLWHDIPFVVRLLGGAIRQRLLGPRAE
ncbi:WecB/TagA/CpsF family glycosyltransferase [Thioalkalivibrio sp. XN279]|uniref:WecB/TagA/CpsF family glycosyltransferase n=1 Tax=Thioalkalivibrio sp. XN279 TaxID=2714953 RepID=UPI00140A605F|nr:WecB/TagA/CpsF family glycosyltransferase [Thioalkalivibrio sp. XN279]NHA15347.1 WecB/TagA/CpsF family glycosyltransferase [Thioalkalivibrio sp. XN279]